MTRITRTLVVVVASAGITAGVGAVAAQTGGAEGVDRHQTMAYELTSIAQWANQHGLAGLSPASLRPAPAAAAAPPARDVFADIPAPTYARDVFADIPAPTYPRDVFASLR